MGRYRRKKHNYRGSESSRTEEETQGERNQNNNNINGQNSSGRIFEGSGNRETLRKYRPNKLTSSDREQILTYLKEYRHRVDRHFSEIDQNTEDAHIHGEDLWICGHEFPALTTDLLSKPYLQLPSTLEGKQRKIIHELCVDGMFNFFNFMRKNFEFFIILIFLVYFYISQFYHAIFKSCVISFWSWR